jgi:hypothetical protein
VQDNNGHDFPEMADSVNPMIVAWVQRTEKEAR